MTYRQCIYKDCRKQGMVRVFHDCYGLPKWCCTEDFLLTRKLFAQGGVTMCPVCKKNVRRGGYEFS